MNIRKILCVAAVAAMTATVIPARSMASDLPTGKPGIMRYFKASTYLKRVERDGLKRTREQVKAMKANPSGSRRSKNILRWWRQDRNLFMATLLTEKWQAGRAAAIGMVPGFFGGLVTDLVVGTPGTFTAAGTATGTFVGSIVERGLRLHEVFVQGAPPNPIGQKWNKVLAEQERGQ